MSQKNAASEPKPRLTALDFTLSIQHLFAMFGATVLVPLLTGMNPAVALVSAGIGTLLFHLVTKGIVPVFLGSSFAFIAAIAAVVGNSELGIEYAQGGIIAAGAVYLLFALLAYFIGADNLRRFFPPVVTGPVIIVIGVNLAGTAINDARGANMTGADPLVNWLIALFVLIIVVLASVFAKGFFKLVPILTGIVGGYLLCLVLNACGVFHMNFAPIAQASWVNIPYVTEGFFTLPKFNWMVILSIAPVALVTFMEHVGDITTNGAVVGKDFFKNPGLHRTLLGDGLATMVAGFIGGPPNTTYSENTGVLATTKNYNPRLLRLTAVFAIILGLFGKFGAVLQTIPDPVKGGVEIILFGMIASIGIRTLAESDLDFTNSRNLIIVSLILVLGLGISAIGGITIGSLNISGLFVATVVGVLANAVLPSDKATAKE